MAFKNTKQIVINEGCNPKENGMYVAYVNPRINVPYAEKHLLMYYDGWTYLGSDQKYRGKIYGYVGPLPAYDMENSQYKD